MTPSPTPTPKSRLAKFLLQQWGEAGSNVQVLCDNYGRVLTHYVENGDYREAAVWVPGSGRYDMETAGDTELANLINQVGYNDAITEIVNDGNVTINDNGETETLIWDATTNDWTVDVDLFSNGVPTMFYVPVTVGGTVIRVLCDADGKAVRVPEWYEFGATIFRIEGEGAEMDLDTIHSTASEYTTIINALGGYVDITNLSGGEDIELLVKDGFILYYNTGNDDVTPTVNELPAINPLKLRVNNNDLWLTDSLGRLVVVNVPGRGGKVFSAVFEDEENKQDIATRGSVDSGDATGIAAELGWEAVNLNGENYDAGSYDFVSGNVTYHFDYDRTQLTPTPFEIYSNE